MSHSQNLQVALINPVDFPKNAPFDARCEFLDVIKAMFDEYGYTVIKCNSRNWTSSTAWWDLQGNASLVLEYDRDRYYWEISASNCKKPITDGQLAYWSENPESFQSFLRVCEVIDTESEKIDLDLSELTIQELNDLFESVKSDRLLSESDRYVQILDIHYELDSRKYPSFNS